LGNLKQDDDLLRSSTSVGDTVIQKICLVNAPNDDSIHDSGSASLYPHLGLLSIATHIKKIEPDVEIRVLDGSVSDLKSVINSVSGDLVGISTLTPSYRNALAISKRAKEQGAITVLGNDHASSLWRQILNNQNSVDYVACGNTGEITLACLIRALNGADCISNVPNIAWRHKGIPTRNILTFKHRSSFGRMPIPDRSLIEQEHIYVDNYTNTYGKWHSSPVKQTTVNIARGCAWGANPERRCTFCDISDLSPRTLDVSRACNEIRVLKENGYNLLYEVCDSFSHFAIDENCFVERLLHSSLPKVSGLSWFVYGRADEIVKPGVIKLLKSFGVVRINIGIDSGDDLVLRGMSKGTTVSINEEALRLCDREDIQMHISFVFGGMGENRDSLMRTVDFISTALEKYKGIVAIDPSVLLPLPNSRAWSYLEYESEGRKAAERFGVVPSYKGNFIERLGEQDILDTSLLAAEWVDTFCSCSYEDILSAQKMIYEMQREYGFVLGGFGVKDS
jgi:anaerobic magnesium-protoporphyrin IX monomethyl ester cyclase